MPSNSLRFLITITASYIFLISCNTDTKTNQQATFDLRFASYNVALFRNEAGQLAKDLQSGEDPQIQNIAAVIQHIDADVIGLFEFDYDSTGQLLRDFQNNYLSHPQQGESPIDYPYQMQFPSNTGILTPVDYNEDGKIELPNDAYGYGKYAGQYAFAILSKFPLEKNKLRSYQNLLWKQMPGAKKPIKENGEEYYSSAVWDQYRLSSKNHVDVPVKISDGTIIHTILSHPTPPVFDGPEDRNGLRNYDEIRLLKDYIEGQEYLVDDQGHTGGLAEEELFVIMGDLNADPIDGDSAPGAINQLLNSELVNPATAMGTMIPSSKGGKLHNQKKEDKGDPAFDSAFFGKRIDYVLLSKRLQAVDSGVFWPTEEEKLYEAVKEKNASDHLLVWVDLKTP